MTETPRLSSDAELLVRNLFEERANEFYRRAHRTMLAFVGTASLVGGLVLWATSSAIRDIAQNRVAGEFEKLEGDIKEKLNKLESDAEVTEHRIREARDDSVDKLAEIKALMIESQLLASSAENAADRTQEFANDSKEQAAVARNQLKLLSERLRATKDVVDAFKNIKSFASTIAKDSAFQKEVRDQIINPADRILQINGSVQADGFWTSNGRFSARLSPASLVLKRDQDVAGAFVVLADETTLTLNTVGKAIRRVGMQTQRDAIARLFVWDANGKGGYYMRTGSDPSKNSQFTR